MRGPKSAKVIVGCIAILGLLPYSKAFAEDTKNAPQVSAPANGQPYLLIFDPDNANARPRLVAPVPPPSAVSKAPLLFLHAKDGNADEKASNVAPAKEQKTVKTPDKPAENAAESPSNDIDD